MVNKEYKSLLLIIVFAILSFLYFMKNSNNIQSKIFNNRCFECHEYNYNDYENIDNSSLYLLNNKKIKNINLTYSRFFSKRGNIYISYEELNEKGFWIERKGKSKDVNPKDIHWTIFNTFHIKFKNNFLILNADENFFKSNQIIFLNATTEAFIDSRKKI